MDMLKTPDRTWEKIIKRFLSAKAAVGDSRKKFTRLSYSSVCENFLGCMLEEFGEVLDPMELKPSFIPIFLEMPVQSRDRNHQRHLKSNSDLADPSISTQNLRLAVLTGLYDMAIYLGYALTNPARSYRNVRGKLKGSDNLASKTLSHDERDKFFCALSGLYKCPHIEARNLAIFKIFEGTGIRLSGMTGLNLEDICFDEFELEVTEKGDKTRVVPILDSAQEPLLDWVNNHRPYLIRERYPTSALWVGKSGKRVKNRSIGLISNKVMKKCGFEKDYFGPHIFRHTFATDSIEQGVDIRDLAEVMGHASISTTQTYDHSSNKIIINRFRKARDRAIDSSKDGK